MFRMPLPHCRSAHSPAMMTVGRFTADRISAAVGPVAVVRYGALLSSIGMLTVVVSGWLPLTLLGWGPVRRRPVGMHSADLHHGRKSGLRFGRHQHVSRRRHGIHRIPRRSGNHRLGHQACASHHSNVDPVCMRPGRSGLCGCPFGAILRPPTDLTADPHDRHRLNRDAGTRDRLDLHPAPRSLHNHSLPRPCRDRRRSAGRLVFRATHLARFERPGTGARTCRVDGRPIRRHRCTRSHYRSGRRLDGPRTAIRHRRDPAPRNGRQSHQRGISVPGSPMFPRTYCPAVTSQRRPRCTARRS